MHGVRCEWVRDRLGNPLIASATCVLVWMGDDARSFPVRVRWRSTGRTNTPHRHYTGKLLYEDSFPLRGGHTWMQTLRFP